VIRVILNALTILLVFAAVMYFARRITRAVRRKGTDETGCCSVGCSEKRRTR
jgi:hypothetical protein